MKLTDTEIEEYVSTLRKSIEIQKDSELMRELQPHIDDMMKSLAEVKDLKSLWQDGLKKARAEEEKAKDKKDLKDGKEDLGEKFGSSKED